MAAAMREAEATAMAEAAKAAGVEGPDTPAMFANVDGAGELVVGHDARVGAAAIYRACVHMQWHWHTVLRVLVLPLKALLCLNNMQTNAMCRQVRACSFLSHGVAWGHLGHVLIIPKHSSRQSGCQIAC